MSAYDAGKVLLSGDCKESALSVVGLLPFVPGIGGTIKNVARSADALPMDEASRLARAKEMGFGLNMSLYHGTAADFPAFDASRSGQVSRSQAADMVVHAARDPETASDFADLAAGAQGNGQNILPLWHRAERPVVIDLDGSDLNHEVAATLDDLWSQDYDAALLRNHTTPGGKTGKQTVVARDTSQLRSWFAAFDPTKKDSSNLLASLAAGRLRGAGALGASSGEDY